MHLDGKTAIITGAGRGIGMEVAYLLAKEGAIVTVNDPGLGRGGEEEGETPAEEVVARSRRMAARQRQTQTPSPITTRPAV